MPSLADAFRDESEKQGRALGKTFGKFEVAATSPFTVYMDGSTEAMPALKVSGASYSVGTTGIYLLIRQGQKPVCIPTTA